MKKPGQHTGKRDWFTKAICRVNALWIGIKYKTASRLDEKFKVYSRKKATLVLAVFTLSIAVMLIYTMLNGFYRYTDKVILVPNISRTNLGQPFNQKPIEAAPAIIKERLKRGRHYLESIAIDPERRHIYDSLLKRRPGIMDSLRQAEAYYNTE